MKDALKRISFFLQRMFAKNAWRSKVLELCHFYPDEIEDRKQEVFFKLLTLQVPANSFYFILESYGNLKILSQHLSPRYYFENNKFIIEFETLKLNPTTAEEVFIMVEIFVSGTYQALSQQPLVIIDVGMNVGFASIFFASNKDVVKVYSFEPFPKTFVQATENFSLNPAVAGKIKSFNHGLSDKIERVSVEYNYENKGQVGIYGTSMIRSSISLVETVSIQLNESATELKQIFEQHPNASFALKLDCEGAEYRILENLHNSDLLKGLSIIFIEWHERGPGELLQILKASGFNAFYQQFAGKPVGMIYASK